MNSRIARLIRKFASVTGTSETYRQKKKAWVKMSEADRRSSAAEMRTFIQERS